MNNELILVFFLFGLLVIAECIRIAWHLLISRRLTNSIVKFERHFPAATKRILFIGDSTGYGTGVSHYQHSIVGRIGKDFPEAHIENYSKGGQGLSKALNILQDIANTPGKAMFDVVIIMIGGIDIVYGTPFPFVRRSLKGVIARSKQVGRETILISPNNTGLAPLYRFPLSLLYQRRAKQFSTLYQNVAHEEGIRHVTLFEDHRDALSVRSLFARDNTHPNDEGYGLWYTHMKQTIVAALKNHNGHVTK